MYIYLSQKSSNACFFDQSGSILSSDSYSIQAAQSLTHSPWKASANVVPSRRIRIKKAFGTLHHTLLEERESRGLFAGCPQIMQNRSHFRWCFYCISLWLILIYLLTLSVHDSWWKVLKHLDNVENFHSTEAGGGEANLPHSPRFGPLYSWLIKKPKKPPKKLNLSD